MSGIDAFLDLCDADPDWDSGDEDGDDPFERLVTNAPATTMAEKPEAMAKDNQRSFSQMFGTPHQLPGGGGPITPPSKSKPTDIVLDPHSKLRLIRSTIRLETDEYGVIEDSLRGRNIGISFVPLSKVGASPGSGPQKSQSEFWTTGVLTKKIPGSRTSANGNNYSLWELHDLENDSVPKFTLFLFGGTGELDSSKFLSVGSLIDLINPRTMGEGKLSVSASNQLRFIGAAKDYGVCGTKRKDGTPCPNPVNSFKCPACIHHVGKELRKTFQAEKPKGKNFKVGRGGGQKSNFKLLPQSEGTNSNSGIITTNFGPNFMNQQSKSKEMGIDFTPGLPAPAKKKPTPKAAPIRMELQDPTNTLKRNPVTLGNHSSISFRQESKSSTSLLNLLPKNGGDSELAAPKPLNLDPNKNRHLTESEREMLQQMDADTKSKSKLPSLLVGPNAGSKNFIKFLQLRNPGPETSEAQTPIVIPRTPNSSNMRSALSILHKIGPIVKKDPNAVRRSNSQKRKLEETDSAAATASTKKQEEAETFKKILNAKSSHSALVEDNQETDYFTKNERKEALESKMMATWNVPVTAVLCTTCKYIAQSQSDYCKQNKHTVRIVKATKRFFSCKNCGNRTMSLDRLPKFTCSNCSASSWIPAPMGKERKVTLESEKLVIRGDEEKFLGSAGSKMFL